MCGENIQYRVEGRSKNIIDSATAALLEPLKNGFVIRYFRIWKKYKSDYRNPQLKYYEEIRCFYDNKGIETYLFDFFKQTNVLRWCRSKRDFYLTNTSVYPNTIDSSLMNTRWEFSGLKEFINMDGSIVNLPNYLNAYLNHPFLEKLVKVGLRRLAVDVVDYNNFMPMDPESPSVLNMLGITRSELRTFKELDISKSGYTFFMKAKSMGISLTPEIFREYEQYGIYMREMIDHLKYSTFHKINKYLHLKCEKLDCKAKKLFPELKKQLEWENENYAILVPQSFEEFEQEGAALHICVGSHSYYKQMANGNTIILFLRKKSEIEKPYYTLELRDQKIVQSQTFGHENATKEIEKVINQFLKEKVICSGYDKTA